MASSGDHPFRVKSRSKSKVGDRGDNELSSSQDDMTSDVAHRSKNRCEDMANTKIRERLRCLKDSKLHSSPRNGPVVAHPLISNASNGPTPPPRQSGLGEALGARSRRHKSAMRSTSEESQRLSDPRSPSPLRCSDEDSLERRIERTKRMKLYLLQQPGPHIFLVGTEYSSSTSGRYRVVVGPQSCTCTRPSPCVHLLFVMLRVLKVPENDPQLTKKKLKNYEVDTLFRKYQNRKQAKLKKHSPTDKDVDDLVDVKERAKTRQQSPSRSRCSSDDENLCSICLLEMKDGQIFSRCNSACQNNFHKKCISVWFEECRSQNEPLTCPLCRAVWETLSPLPPTPPTPSSNPTAFFVVNPLMTQSAAPTTGRSHLSSARPNTTAACPELDELPQFRPPGLAPGTFGHCQGDTNMDDWIAYFGASVAQYILSPTWDHRELALKKIAETTLRRIVEGEETLASPQRCLTVREAFRVALRLLDDHIYNVFVAALRAFREILGYLVIRNFEEQVCLQTLIAPILRRLLRLSSDPQIRKAQLVLSTLVEMALGQDGELAVGREVNKDSMGIGGVEYLVSFVLTSAHFYPDHLLGRLLLLDRLFDQFSIPWAQLKPALAFAARHIHPQTDPTRRSSSNCLPGGSKIYRQARKVFVTGARLLLNYTSPSFSALDDRHGQGAVIVERLLGTMDLELQDRLRRKLDPLRHQHTSPRDVNNASHCLLVPAPNRGLTRSCSVGVPMQGFENFVRITPEPAYDAVAPSEPSCIRASDMNDRQSPYFLEAVSFRQEVLSDNNPPCTSPEDRLSDVVAMRQSSDTMLSRSSFRQSSEELLEATGEALSRAVRIQTLRRQNPLPLIPGLQTILPESGEDGASPFADSPFVESECYVEGVDWVEGPLLGTGAFSHCFQARDKRTGTLMAVKKIGTNTSKPGEDEEILEAVQREVELMVGLSHPNVIRLLGAVHNAVKKVVHVFVEWMPGGSVSSILSRYGAFSEQVVTSYTLQVVRGLQYLHENGIIHRDLKGANMLVNSTGNQVRISDFGASARLATQETHRGQFQGHLFGTIAFMAPEIFRGEDYRRSCDIWAVGCVIIEMLTAKPPWNDKGLSNEFALIFAISTSNESPTFPPAISDTMTSLLQVCLNVNPTERPTAKDLLSHSLFLNYTSLDRQMKILDDVCDLSRETKL